MKKVLVFILAFLYLGVSSGIAMEIHYCMGKRAGVEFYSAEKDKCGKCGMKDKKGCCNDEHKFYKLNDSHKNVSNDLNVEIPAVAIVTQFPLYQVHFYSAAADKKVQNHSPPIYTKPSACILNCVFRI